MLVAGTTAVDPSARPEDGRRQRSDHQQRNRVQAERDSRFFSSGCERYQPVLATLPEWSGSGFVKRRAGAARLAGDHPKAPFETPMSVLEQLSDDQRNEWQAESQPGLDDETVSDRAATTLVGRQASLVAPAALKPGAGLLDESVAFLDLVERE